MSTFSIRIIRPPGYLHSEAFREVGESLRFALLRLGFASVLSEGPAAADPGPMIVLGAHLLDAEGLARLPRSAIVYNLEQVTPELAARNPGYFDLLERCQVWDYSARNAAGYAQLGRRVAAAVLPAGYVPELTRIPAAEKQDIDVLFYGSLNDRRRRLIEEIRGAGLQVLTVFGVYGPARDALIGRAKLVLNLHFYATQIFEIVRVSYLLANRKAVVTESSPTTEIDADLRDAVRTAREDELVDACVELAFDPARRQALEEHGFQCFSARRLEDLLRPLVGRNAHPVRDPVARYPLKVNLGSGKDWRDDCLNLDLDPKWRPDALLDIGRPLELPCEIETTRFGRLALHEGMFEEIAANDVLEHVPALVTCMTNCLRLLKIGGAFRIRVPYDLSYGAWQDPTHVRAFNEKSWLYYTDWFWYLGWTEYRFEIAEQTYVLSPFGIEQREAGRDVKDVLRQPRAVDALQVVLRKCLLTDEDRRTLAQYNAGR
jgi:hypothetical protein